MTRKILLWLIRLVDRSAYVCLGCDRIRNGPGAKVRGGWVCSVECYDRRDPLWQPFISCGG